MTLRQAVEVALRRRSPPSTLEARASSPGQTQHHPAMAGITVSPVHGWHCICERCAAARKQG
jgi:hypothetical protein